MLASSESEHKTLLNDAADVPEEEENDVDELRHERILVTGLEGSLCSSSGILSRYPMGKR